MAQTVEGKIPPQALAKEPLLHLAAYSRRVAGEVCHRAKNDLQTIANLIALAAPYAKSAEDLATAVEGRVGALSVCYTLVAGEGAQPRLDLMAEEVLRRLLWRYGGLAQVERQVQELPLSLRICSPLSLWLHEVVGNALIHGLGRSSRPKLVVQGEMGRDGLSLSVTDNGPGLPSGFDLERHSRLGLRLAKAVAINDLRGRMDLNQPGRGLQVRLTVPAEELANLNRSAWQ